MARQTGPDVIVRLMDDVAQLKANFSGLQANLTDVRASMNAMEGSVKDMQVALRSAVSITGRIQTHLSVMLEQLGESAAKLDDHEERLRALESGRS